MFPTVDAGRPATLSPAVMTDLVRGALGFSGLLVSDDLGMKAVADRFPIEQLVVEGLAAGLDQFILRGPGERQVAAWEALVRAVEASPVLLARLRESLIRIVGFKATLQVGPPAPADQLAQAFPWPAHQGLAASFAVAPNGDGSAGGPGPGAPSPVTIY
jgi:beta-N-acetylhexosaminidase